jgi:hypothetical protein
MSFIKGGSITNDSFRAKTTNSILVYKYILPTVIRTTFLLVLETAFDKIIKLSFTQRT